MTITEAEAIKSKIEYINQTYAPFKLTFKMFQSGHRDDDGNWFVTIVYNYTENEWMTFFSMNHSYLQVMDKLAGLEFGLEAVKAYNEEYGSLDLNKIPPKQDLSSESSPASDEWWDQS